MSINVILWAVVLSLLPIAELRGGIPFAVLNGMPNLTAYFLCVGVNALVAPIVFVFLSTLHKLLIHWKFYSDLFEKVVARTRKKIHDKVEKYGYLGITIFVAIPLPITGAWTGSLGAWVLGMNKWKTFLACCLGVIISGIIVSVLVYFGLTSCIFIKQMH